MSWQVPLSVLSYRHKAETETERGNEMEQAQDKSGRKAFKISLMGCLGVLAAFIIVVILMVGCTLVVTSGDENPKHDKGSGHSQGSL